MTKTSLNLLAGVLAVAAMASCFDSNGRYACDNLTGADCALPDGGSGGGIGGGIGGTAGTGGFGGTAGTGGSGGGIAAPVGTWQVRDGGSGPSPRFGHAMALDEGANQVLLSAGQNANGPLDDTWTWGAGRWTDNGTASALVRSQHAAAWDGLRVVLYGGFGTSGTSALVNTLGWATSSWTVVAPGVPLSGRYGHAMASLGDGGVVGFGGFNNAGGTTRPSDTLLWNAATASWTAIPNSGGPAWRQGLAMAYDKGRGRVVMFGGEDSSARLLGDVWEWNGAGWASRGQGSGSTFPSARRRHAMAYDEGRGLTVLFGGVDSSGQCSDTWLWDGTQWTQLDAGTSVPPARSLHAMAWDGQHIVLFGGQDATTSPLGDTWVLMP